MNNQIVTDLNRSLDEVGSAFKREFSGVRSNRPVAQLIEDIPVEYAGSKLPIKQLGTISVVPPRELQVSAWDRDAAVAIGKAIDAAGRGLSAGVEGVRVFVKLPELTEDRRKELLKVARNIAEQSRIKIRAARDESNRHIERSVDAKELTKDDRFKLRELVQKAVDKHTAEIEQLLVGKEKEITE